MNNFLRNNSIVTFGGILGLYFVAQALLLYNLGLYLEKNTTASIISIIISIVVLYLGIKFKKNEIESFNVMQSIKIGISISFIAGLIYVAYSLLFIYNIAPDTIEMSIAQTQIILEEKGMSAEDIAKSLEMTRKAFIPSLILGVLIFNVFIGFIVALISGLILQSEK